MPLTNERWRRVKETFDTVVDLAPNERAAVLARSCADDTTVRREVESLLHSDDQADGFIENAIAEVPRDLLDEIPRDPAIGQQFGAYKIVREIGRGGLGTVYLAERADAQYQKQVAIKVVRRGLDTDDILQRFRNERQILAQLDHPNIARLIDGGTTGDGLPYFVMEYVEGEPLLGYCRTRALSTADRLMLFRKVCAAVTYAHQHLVIHRDLKPSNILMTPDGEPKLLDFGIAKLMHAEDNASLLTLPELRVMTPEYASPEQIAGGDITTVSDVYALGVLLFELLTGARPYLLKTRAPDEIAHAITTQEPSRPSAAIGNQKSDIRNRKSLRGDLDNIVLMAMRKEPVRRYASVGQFSEDIRRHTDGLPVIARSDTIAYRTAKFVRRNTIGVAAAAIVVLALFAGLFAFAHEARIAAAQRDQARVEKTNAERVSAFLLTVLLVADPSWNAGGSSVSRELTTGRLLETASTRARKELADQPAVLGGILRSLGNTYRALGEYDQAERTLRDARDILGRTYGWENYDTVNVSYNLAQCLMQAGKYPEAESLYRPAVEYFRKHVDRTNDPQVTALAGTLNDFAFLLRLEGHPHAAEALLHEAMEFAPRWHGAARAIVGIHLSHLGLNREDQGDLAGAEKYERDAIAEFRSLPGGDRLETGTTLISLGQVLLGEGDYAQAEAAIQEGLAIYHRFVGDEHPYVALALDRLARVQCLQGDYSAARHSCDQAIAIQNGKLPPEHPSRAIQLTTLGMTMTRSGSAAEGEPHLRRALALREKILPPLHRLVAETKVALGECLVAQQHYAEAEPFLLEALVAAKTALGESHPRTAEASGQLTSLYDAWGKPDEAARYR